MAIIAQGSCEIELDDSGGTAVEIQGQGVSATLTVNNQLTNQVTFGDYWQSTYDGVKSASWSFTYEVTTAIDESEASDIVGDWVTGASAKPGARTLAFSYPDDSTAGSITYSGEAHVSSAGLVQGNAGVGTPMTMQVSGMYTGALTKTDVT